LEETAKSIARTRKMATRLQSASFQKTVITPAKATINEYVNRKLLFYQYFYFSISASELLKITFTEELREVTGRHIPGILATLHIIIFIIPVSYYNKKLRHNN
jgi:hypothetical protein